jgi:hypothetical protein
MSCPEIAIQTIKVKDITKSKKSYYLRFIFGFRYNFQKGKQQNNKQKKGKNYDDNAKISVESY